MSDDYFPFSGDLSNPDVLAYWRMVGERLAAAPLPDELSNVGDRILVMVRDHEALGAAIDAALDKAYEVEDQCEPFFASNGSAIAELRRDLRACGAIAEDAPMGTFGDLFAKEDDLYETDKAADAVVAVIEKLKARQAPAPLIAHAHALVAGLREHARLSAVEEQHFNDGKMLELKQRRLRDDFELFFHRMQRAFAHHYKKGGRGHQALFGTRGLTLSN